MASIQVITHDCQFSLPCDNAKNRIFGLFLANLIKPLQPAGKRDLFNWNTNKQRFEIALHGMLIEHDRTGPQLGQMVLTKMLAALFQCDIVLLVELIPDNTGMFITLKCTTDSRGQRLGISEFKVGIASSFESRCLSLPAILPRDGASLGDPSWQSITV